MLVVNGLSGRLASCACAFYTMNENMDDRANMTKSADAIDNLLLAILTSSLVVPTIVQSYELDIRLFWMPAICYAIWIGYVGYLKPKVTFSDSLERSTVERIRGWSYVLSLPVTLIANFLLSEVLPKTLTTYIMGTAAVGIVLSAVVVTFPRRLFRKEIIYMNKNQALLRTSGDISAVRRFPHAT